MREDRSFQELNTNARQSATELRYTTEANTLRNLLGLAISSSLSEDLQHRSVTCLSSCVPAAQERVLHSCTLFTSSSPEQCRAGPTSVHCWDIFLDEHFNEDSF